ncbi:hypothetical protein KKC91_08880 [bacterium]|nr:hypothetical protein [bacterium]
MKTMTERERYVNTLLFQEVDKIPFTPGAPRESTLKRWHKEGLAENRNYLDAVSEKIGIKLDTSQNKRRVGVGVSFKMIPAFEEKVLEHKDGHYVVQDWMGNITEISDKYDYTYIRSGKDFVTRRWLKFPVEDHKSWEDMEKRYNSETAGRFPDDFNERCERLQNRDYPVGISFPGPFWQLREWCGFEPLCILMIEDPEFVMDMISFWADFVVRTMEPILEKIKLDFVWMSEDMAYKAHSMISPEMTRRFLLPVYQKWIPLIKQSGCPIVDMDSDGYVGELVPIWIEAGINCCDPMEVAAQNDIVSYRQKFAKRMAFKGGVDKRAIAKGGDIIKKELERIIPPLFKDGGYIPGCDHGVPHDISWQNFVYYCRLLAEYTGWLK